MKKSFVLVIVCLLLAGMSFAQGQYGNIRGTVTDPNGEPLPGTTITIASQFGTRSEVTSEKGGFRFINLSPGDYTLKAEMPGFKSFQQNNLVVQIGSNIELPIKMEVAALESEITVISNAPVVDTKKTAVGVNISTEYLRELPSARDPWSLIAQLPGTVSGSENVGGASSGTQSGLGDAKGAMSGSSVYNMDGITITDGGGGSPSYYDYESFDQVEVTFAGNDASVQTGGTSINFVTKRGSNKFDFGMHTFYTSRHLQDTNLSQQLKDYGYKGDTIYMIADYGLQLGGPIIRDHLWIWAGGGMQDIRRRTIANLPDEVQIQAMNFKLNGMLGTKTRAEFGWIFDEKVAYGRGASVYRTLESTYLQEGPARQFKLEVEQYFSDNFMVSLKGSAFPSWWALRPIGGWDVQARYDDITGVYRDSYDGSYNGVSSYGARADGNLFFENLLNASHEMKFGIEWRHLPRNYTSTWGGDCQRIFSNGVPYLARVYRERAGEYDNYRYSAYLQDNISLGKLTVNLGARFDRENATVGKSSIDASRVASDFLGAIDYEGIDPGNPTTWGTFSPRLGLTYDLTADKKTILKLSAARLGNTMSADYANHVSPVSLAFAEYKWKDLDGDLFVTKDELVGYPIVGLTQWSNFDPANPTSLKSPNIFADNTISPTVDELVLGLERELFTDISFRITAFARKSYNFIWTRPIGITKDNFLGPVNKTMVYDNVTYNYSYWYLDKALPSGLIRENRPDYYETHRSIDVAAEKRMSHKWMATFSMTLQKNIRHYGENGYYDPTNIQFMDGKIIENVAGGVTWIAKATWFVELPLGISFSGFGQIRNGKVAVPYLRVDSPERAAVKQGTRVDVYTADIGTTRVDTFYNLDLRAGKEFRLGRIGTIRLAVDLFNVFNSNFMLARDNQINRATAGRPTEILKPRVLRFSIRYKF